MAAAVPLATACVVRSTSNPPGPHTNPPGPTASNDHAGHEGHGDHRPPTQSPPGTEPATPSRPPTQNPPTQNPPTGQTPEPTWPTPTTGGGGKPPTGNPPPPTPTSDPAPNPPSNLPTHAATWTVTKAGDTCRAAMPVNCPKPQTPGGAVPTCNPPPPMAFTCPPQMASTGSVTVTRKAGETDCTVSEYFPECPVNAKCAKKPSYRTACPTR